MRPPNPYHSALGSSSLSCCHRVDGLLMVDGCSSLASFDMRNSTPRYAKGSSFICLCMPSGHVFFFKEVLEPQVADVGNWSLSKNRQRKKAARTQIVPPHSRTHHRTVCACFADHAQEFDAHRTETTQSGHNTSKQPAIKARRAMQLQNTDGLPATTRRMKRLSLKVPRGLPGRRRDAQHPS